MRKTRLVILPTKCLHQMGFLLLFLSCPVIGDWGRIRPESENSHKAIQIDREGTCGLQRDPPGKLVNFLNDNGSERCQLSEDIGSYVLTEKSMFGEVRSDERQIYLERITRQWEGRQVTGDRKDFRRALQRVVDERRDVRRDSQRIRRSMRENLQIRRSIELQRSSRSGRQSERAMRKQAPVSERLVHSDDEMSTRIERERIHRTRRMNERQNERRIEQQRGFNRREGERTIRTAQETRERQETERFVRPAERERRDTRRDDNRRRSVQERFSKSRENDETIRRTPERSQDRQNERLSLSARKKRDNGGRSENRRGTENSERRSSQIRKSRIDERTTRSLDERQRTENRRSASAVTKSSEREVRERRFAPLNDKMDRIMEAKSTRTKAVEYPQNLAEDTNMKGVADEKLARGITKWMDLKRLENFKAGDWTANCVIGAVVYFLSTRQTKAV